MNTQASIESKYGANYFKIKFQYFSENLAHTNPSQSIKNLTSETNPVFNDFVECIYF